MAHLRLLLGEDGDDLQMPLAERREFERLELPASAFAVDAHGNDLGRVVEIGGGGFLVNPASAVGAGLFESRPAARRHRR